MFLMLKINIEDMCFFLWYECILRLVLYGINIIFVCYWLVIWGWFFFFNDWLGLNSPYGRVNKYKIIKFILTGKIYLNIFSLFYVEKFNKIYFCFK